MRRPHRVILGPFAPDDAPGDASARVRAGVANVRARPSERAELVHQLPLGSPVRRLGRRGGWRRVQSADGYRGWVSEDSLVEEIVVDFAEDGQGILVVEEWIAWIRRLPRPGAAVVTEVTAGVELPLTGAHGAWRRVRIPGGEMGWIPARAVKRARRWSTHPSPAALLGTARSCLGCPYLWGGTTPKGFDCSGFVQHVFARHGILLPRDSWQQREVTRPLGRGRSAGAADLLFFGPRPDATTHVAIAMGKGRFIHAGPTVRIESLDPDAADFNPRLAERFRAASCLPGLARPRSGRR